ncbi:dihydrofolate reductase family protein [Cellulomonas sp. DKR-3]|uniref:Dihydrofolate reductase family protein n=1 Tax=Cellulomonas fulva TaxID=2835530 RepID=A0ABS5U1R8_9CELL|nr:dihydrofolate reductase family protein [Cellulomonas fulva]MBT0995261.1 dihydrofolate reductase family protein [Cellulomonas fulva]
MATIVSTLFISLDGVAEVDPAWHFPYFDEHMGAAVGEDYEDVDVLLLGRVTYDSFAGAWPGREAAGGEDAGFATTLGDTRKVVATRGTQDLGWRNAEAAPDLLTAAAALQADPVLGKVLVPGSISVVRQLIAAGLLDELRLLVHPVLVGGGDRLLQCGDAAAHLRLLGSETYPTGVVRLRYAVGAAPVAQSYDDVADKVPGASTD